MKRPAAELAATERSNFRACYVPISALPTLTQLQPNPAQQACDNTARRFEESSTYRDSM
jgi:hypothetical protein